VKAYTIREAAAELGLSRQRVHVLIREHRIPVVRTPRRLLLPAGSLAALRALPRRPGRPWPQKDRKTGPEITIDSLA
jgi:excisionase family DNA binding protein